MKKKNSYRPKKARVHVKTIAELIVSKLAMLLGCIIPISIFIAYAMKIDFFFITRILAIFILIISIAAYLKGEIMYPHHRLVHKGDLASSKKNIVYKKHIINFSFSLRNGTLQVVLSMLIIIVLTYLGQSIYKLIG